MNTLEPLGGQEIAQLTNEEAREYGFLRRFVQRHAELFAGTARSSAAG